MLRVWRWVLRFFAREFAPQYIVLLALAIAAMFFFDLAEGAVGQVLVAIFGLLILVEIRFAYLAWTTSRAIERELQDEIPGEAPESRFPKSHLWFPLLMLFARSVKVERNVVFHSEERRRVRLDIYRPQGGVPDGERLPAVIQVHGGGWSHSCSAL
jgi:acetyl esterase/lipase